MAKAAFGVCGHAEGLPRDGQEVGRGPSGSEQTSLGRDAGRILRTESLSLFFPVCCQLQVTNWIKIS